MRILCTFPGKYGDLLWALPTIRAISRRVGTPVDLVVAAPFGSICPLIEQQNYIGRCWASPDWQVQDTAPISPRVPPIGVVGSWDLILHLGYTGWPMPDLVRHTLATANAALTDLRNPGNRVDYWIQIEEHALDLSTPWITTPRVALPLPPSHLVAVGFTDEHFELKYGVSLLQGSGGLPCTAYRVIGASARWQTEASLGGLTWEGSAETLAGAAAFLGCCSALHVLAVAMGVPAIVMEPNPHRHNAVFYPLGTTGPQVTLVRGVDGLPTWDSRHTADTLTHVLTQRPTQTGVSS